MTLCTVRKETNTCSFIRNLCLVMLHSTFCSDCSSMIRERSKEKVNFYVTLESFHQLIHISYKRKIYLCIRGVKPSGSKEN